MIDNKEFTIDILKEISNRIHAKSNNTLTQIQMVSLKNMRDKEFKKAETFLKSSEIKELPEIKPRKKQVITAKDIEKMEISSEISLLYGDIITPMAKDLIKEKKIKINRK